MGSAMNCIQRIYLCILSLIAVLGCEDVLLMPQTITSDDYSSGGYPVDRLLDGSYGNPWIGATYYEDVIYYFPSPVIVKEVLIQKYYDGYLD